LTTLVSSVTPAQVVVSAAALGALAGRPWRKTSTDLLLMRLLLAGAVTVFAVGNIAFLGPLATAAVAVAACLLAFGAMLERRRCPRAARDRRDHRASV
jgi:hypothetical protein